MVKPILLAGAALLAFASCNNHTENTGGESKAVRKLLDPANMDTTIRPGDNFYLYANNGWLKKNPIPADQTRWGSFSELQENNYTALHELLDNAAKANGSSGSAEQKVGDFYKSAMDTVAIEKAGVTPLNDAMARINGITDANGVLHEVAVEHTMGTNALFAFGVGPDDKNVSKEIVGFYQGGLGMPDRDYYLKTDGRSTKIREAYRAYLVKLFGLMGEDSMMAKKDAADEFGLEEKLAAASMTRTEMRDPYKTYNKFSVASLNSKRPAWIGKAFSAT